LNILWGIGLHGSYDLADVKQSLDPARSVIFNMENLCSDSALVTPDYVAFLSNFLVFDYNQHNVEALHQKLPACRAFEFPIAPSAALATRYATQITESEIIYDLAFYGAMNERRQSILSAMDEMGLSVNMINNKFGAELVMEVMRSRMVLNLHFYEPGLFEVARCLMPNAMGIPILSEESACPQSIDWTLSGVEFAPASELAQRARDIVDSPTRLIELARRSALFKHRTDTSVMIRRLMDETIAHLQGGP
jgi:hypothetical protein